MTFIRDKKKYKVGDKVKSLVEIRNNNGHFTVGHIFEVTRMFHHQREGYTIDLSCPYTGEIATAYSIDNLELFQEKID